VAAHLEPEILVVDEVLAVGDAEFQKKAIGKMQDISKGQGRTVLFVSHNLPSIVQLCNYSILIDKGKIVRTGSTLDVISYYQDFINDALKPVISGNKKIKLNSFIIKNKELITIESFRTFDEINFSLEYTSFDVISKVTFAICFNNEVNQRITSLWTSFINVKFDLNIGNFVLKINVPSIHLNPGTYEVILYVESEGIVLERIDNYKMIIVNYSQKFGLVRIPIADQGTYIEKFNAIINEK
jgi:lipopolysaccharide transport system ATP-binding protein